jgi:hypothetical protein
MIHVNVVHVNSLYYTYVKIYIYTSNILYIYVYIYIHTIHMQFYFFKCLYIHAISSLYIYIICIHRYVSDVHDILVKLYDFQEYGGGRNQYNQQKGAEARSSNNNSFQIWLRLKLPILLTRTKKSIWVAAHLKLVHSHCAWWTMFIPNCYSIYKLVP